MLSKVVEQLHLWFDFLVVVTISLVAIPIIDPTKLTYANIIILKILITILMAFVIFFVVIKLVEEIKMFFPKNRTNGVWKRRMEKTIKQYQTVRIVKNGKKYEPQSNELTGNYQPFYKKNGKKLVFSWLIVAEIFVTHYLEELVDIYELHCINYINENKS